MVVGEEGLLTSLNPKVPSGRERGEEGRRTLYSVGGRSRSSGARFSRAEDRSLREGTPAIFTESQGPIGAGEGEEKQGGL